ncbi:hypothetical protein ACFL1I_08080 [Candidatus Omnitrophota bacterium]
MKILKVMIFCVSVAIILAFFNPWVKGEGSIVKAVDDKTKKLQEADATGVTRGVVQSTKGIVDKTTELFTPIKLKQTLSGFQITQSKNKSLKKIGPKLYLAYLPVLIALFCGLLSLFGRKRLWPIAATFFLSWGMFLVLDILVFSLHREGLFAKIRPCCGLIFTEYAFLGIVAISFLEAIVSAKQKQGRTEEIINGPTPTE